MSNEVREDDELVALAAGGDTEAFGILYSRHLGDIRAYLARHTGSTHLADDLVSETFLRAWRGIHGYTGGKFAAWLTCIARNLLIDHRRLRATQRETSVPEFWDVPSAPSAETTVLEMLDDRHRSRRIAVALSNLLPDQRAALELRFLHEHSIKDTARLLRRSEGAVKSLQHRGTRAMASALRVPA
jgi:RNA polymerase sigma-70 factor (ECF subfamily)